MYLSLYTVIVNYNRSVRMEIVPQLFYNKSLPEGKVFMMRHDTNVIDRADCT